MILAKGHIKSYKTESSVKNKPNINGYMVFLTIVANHSMKKEYSLQQMVLWQLDIQKQWNKVGPLPYIQKLTPNRS